MKGKIIQKEEVQQAKLSTKKCCQTHSKYKELFFKKISIAKIGHYKSQGFKPFFLSSKCVVFLYFKTVKQLFRKCCTIVAFLPLSATVISVDR